jgi:hypothetical protein
MGIGVSVLLLAVGAILAFAVKATTIMGVEVHTVGYIIMAAGVIGLIWSLIVASRYRRATPVDTVVADPPVVVRQAPPVVDERPAAPVVEHRHAAPVVDPQYRPTDGV